jgi:prepilin-type N-terminal cleavage/methylation domain-containing protein
MKRGFTLIELLVAIAIIAILAAMLLPALGRAKSSAGRAACIHNSRHLNLAMRLYADEHEDVIGYTNDIYFAYRESIQPYLGSQSDSSSPDALFACPGDDFPMQGAVGDMFFHSEARGFGFHTQPWTHFSSYFFNGTARGTNNVADISGLEQKAFSSVREPSKTILLGEISGGSGLSTHNRQHPLQFRDPQNVMSFVDGHVAFVRIYWNGVAGLDGFPFFYEPPSGYDYKWSSN